VLPRLFPTSDAVVVGHTDVIGSDEYNLKLSASRGAKAKEELASLLQIKVKSLDSKGVGEAEPLFDNSLPEGRFYNRTVQVIIETPVSEVDNGQ
jgi:outer membrane protein OmpA-like peptidoglycan-associated protein